MLICDHLKIIIYTSLFLLEFPRPPLKVSLNTQNATPALYMKSRQHANVVHFTEVNFRFSTVHLQLRCFFTLWRHFEPELFRDLAMMCMKSRMELSDLGELSWMNIQVVLMDSIVILWTIDLQNPPIRTATNIQYIKRIPKTTAISTHIYPPHCLLLS